MQSSRAALFSAELRKARSFPPVIRAALLGAVALLAVSSFIVAQAASFADVGRADALGGFTTGEVVMLILHYAQVIPVLIGAWIVAQDLPTGPRRLAFLAAPRRVALIGTKLVVAALAAGAAGVGCTAAALVPLMVFAGPSDGTISLVPYAWLISSWVLIAVVTASLVAATRSVTFTVVPLLIWTIGLSDLIAVRVPALSGALDQVMKSAYLPGGATPSSVHLLSAGIQVAVAIALGPLLTARRDVG